MRPLVFVVLAALCALAVAKSSRCVVVSDAWREPRPNVTQQTLLAGKVFYDSSIARCTAFGPQCEEWVEFRAERGQIQCLHQKSHVQFYQEYWQQMSERLAEWIRAHSNVLQTVTHAVVVNTLSSDAIAREQEAAANVESLSSSLLTEIETRERTPSDGALSHEHLHESTTPWAEPPDPHEAWRDHKCDVHKTRTIRCRLVAKKTFLKTRHKPYARRPQSIGWLRDLFHWECETTPQWVNVLEPGPVCPPFFLTERNVCIPVEECVVFIDVDNSNAFSLLYMSAFITLLCLVSLGWITVMYLRKTREKRALAARLAREREAARRRAFPYADADRHASRGHPMYLPSDIMAWLVEQTKRSMARDQEHQPQRR